MKKIVCEICNGSAFVKKDGQFFCQGCGTAYSAEEVKGMMQETEEVQAAAAQVTAAAPNQKLLNTLVMANTAFDAGKLAEAERYCARAIEMDETCYSAWFLKARCAGWNSSVEEPAMNAAVKYFCVAMDSAPEEEKEALKQQAAAELGRIGVALLTQSGEKFAGHPDKFTLFELTENADEVLTAVQKLMDHGVAAPMPAGIQAEIAEVMNRAAAVALENIDKAWKTLEHPDSKQFETYRACCESIDSLCESVIKLSENEESQAIQAYKTRMAGLDALKDKTIFRQEKNQESNELVWISAPALSDIEKTAKMMLSLKYSNVILDLENSLKARKAAEARAAEEAKQQRIKAYWEAHAEEKAQLDAETEKLGQDKQEINRSIAELEDQITEIKQALNVSLPQDMEIEKLKAEIWNLNKGRLGVGIFNFKGQKEVNAKIEPLKQQKHTLETQVKEERKRIKDEVKQKTEPLKTKITFLKKEYTAAENRQAEIRRILTADPAEQQ